MSSKWLSLNSSMTHLIWFDTTQQLQKLDIALLSHRFCHFTFLFPFRDLHVGSLLIALLPSQIVSPTSLVAPISIWDVLGLYETQSPRLSLPLLLYAFVCSSIDYCNSLFTGLPKVQLLPIQTVLSASARFSARLSRFSHISSFMTQLHWLYSPPALNSKFLSSFLRPLLLNIFAITSDTLSLLTPYTVSALPKAMIFIASC